MMTVDPAVLGSAVVGLVTLQLTSLGVLVAVLRFFYRRLDRRFAEVGSDIDRRFTEVDRRFAEATAHVDRRFAEITTDIDRRFAEVDRRFAEARDDRRRIDEHGKEVARLQGVVERTYEPHRLADPVDGLALPR